MNKLDFLKWSINRNIARKVAWAISVFGVLAPSVKELKNLGDIKVEPWGLSFLNDAGEFEKIEGSVSNQPLFRFLDTITIDDTWLPNVTDVTETTVGRLLWNYFTVVYAFGNKYPYINSKISISSVENQIAGKLKDTPSETDTRDTTSFYVDEYLKFVDGINHLEHLSSLAATSLTRKAITSPVGLKKFKADLVKEFDGKLHDPVELAKFKNRLAEFDDADRGNDPCKNFIQGKVKNNGRMRVYLSIGTDQGFEDKLTVTPVTNSLSEGWPTDPEQYVTLMNGTRKGSFDRGSETVKGGVAAKVLLRAANNYVIVDTDCQVNIGIRRRFNAKNIRKLVGKYIIVNGKSIFIENINEAGNLIDKDITVRSPAYCKLEGEKICKVCAGVKLARYGTGIMIPLTEISAILLAASMKSMHSSVLKLAKINIKEVCS